MQLFSQKYVVILKKYATIMHLCKFDSLNEFVLWLFLIFPS